MERRTALKVQEYRHFGGTFFDSVAHAAIFRDNAPYDFGVKTAQLFSSTNNLGTTNKKWTFLTMAQGNYYRLPPGKNEYSWSVAGDAIIDFRIQKATGSAGEQIGRNNEEFDIYLDRDWLHEPMVLKSESDNAPGIKLLGHPSPEGNNTWRYRAKLQDGSPDAWIPQDLLTPGRTLIRISTQVSNEENTKYGGDEFGQMMKLRGVTGQYANKVEFTDRFIRMEMAAAGKGVPNTGTYENFDGKKYRDAFGHGHIYYANIRDKGSNELVNKGFFITNAEKRLLERTEMDREMMCEFGRLEITPDLDTKRIIKSAPGWRQIVRDGQYFPHGGSFTLNEMYDFFHQIFIRRRGFMNREPYLIGGTGAITYLSNLIAAQASTFQTLEPGFAIRPNPSPVGVHENEWEYGFQFTRIKLPMGITLNIMYDPSKDDDRIYREKAPGSYLPRESFNIDIVELGKTEDAAENSSGENLFMAMEDGIDYYFSVANAIDFRNGVVKGGDNVYRFSKQLSIYRELSGSLGCWDASAIGRIEWVNGMI